MITDFEFVQPFVVSNTILTLQTSLEHDLIADYFRKRLLPEGKYTTYFDEDWNKSVMSEMPYREQFKDTVATAFDLWCKERGYTDYNPDQPRWDAKENFFDWVSVWRQGDHHIAHNHPRALVAGTYYPYADEASCKTAYFPSDWTIVSMAEPSLDHDATHHKIRPVTGMMNLWPAWMTHAIGPQGPQESGKERCAISFNICRTT